ncbi:MAG: tetratricopeptide repeat protein [Flavobacteriales bacterium]|nr:tetratricopeptide repeat protein [Flavobacteriales bacterium]
MEFEERWENRQNDKEILDRYESMRSSGSSVYFDIDELELIIEKYFENNQLDRAVEVIHHGLELFPSSTLLLLREAQILAVMGKLSKAIPKLKHLIKLEPTNDEIYLSLASVYSQLRDHKNAITYYARAFELSDDFVRDDIYVDMSLEYQSIGKWNEAISILQKAVKANPENETATYELAHCYDVSDRLGLGVRFFNEFLDEHPYSFSAWYNLGLMHMKLGNFDKAASALEFCTAIESEFTPALQDLATCYFELDEYERAASALLDLIGLEAPDSTILTFLGECFEKLELFERALEYYDEAIEQDQYFFEAFLGKAVVLEELGKPEESVVYLELASELDESGLSATLLANAYATHGSRARAINTYKQLNKRLPHFEEGWLAHIQFFGERKEYENALAVVEFALTENPHSGSLLYRKIAYLHALNQVDKARVLFDYVVASGYQEIDELLESYPEILKDPAFALRIEEEISKS